MTKDKMSDRERLWTAIVEVRDASPRVPNDADTEDIIDAILAAGFGDVAQAKADALDEAAEGTYRHGASSGQLVPSVRALLHDRAAEYRK